MSQLFTLTGAIKHQPAIDEWLWSEPRELFAIARHWFAQIRACGDDVTELMHDGCPTACLHEAAFAYVNVFSSHVNVGFFTGASLNDPHHLLEGTGKRMRHVKIKLGNELNSHALEALISQAYVDVKNKIGNP